MVDTTSASSIERIVEPDIFGEGTMTRCCPITLLTSAHPRTSWLRQQDDKNLLITHILHRAERQECLKRPQFNIPYECTMVVTLVVARDRGRPPRSGGEFSASKASPGSASKNDK